MLGDGDSSPKDHIEGDISPSTTTNPSSATDFAKHPQKPPIHVVIVEIVYRIFKDGDMTRKEKKH